MLSERVSARERRERVCSPIPGPANGSGISRGPSSFFFCTRFWLRCATYTKPARSWARVGREPK